MSESGRPYLLLDGGDAFGNPDSVTTLEDKLRAEFLLRGMDLCGYDAMTLGEEDFRFGESFLAERLAETDFAITSANLVRQEDGLPYVTSFFTKAIADVTVGVIGVMDEGIKDEIELESSIDGEAVTVEPVAGAIEAARAEMGDTDLVVVLAQMPNEQARELAVELTDVDVVVASHDRAAPTAEQLGSGVFASTGYDGKWIAKVGLVLDEEGRLTDASFDPIALDASWEDDPELAALYQEYLQRLETEAEEMAEEIPQETPDGGSYIGGTQCQPCHEAQATQWAGTKHARAFSILVETNHDYSPSCFSCHTTGFGFVGGFLIPTMTPAMKNVQCEACHGAGQEHIANPGPGWSPLAVTQCTKCHTPERSPDFDLDTYLPQVTH